MSDDTLWGMLAEYIVMRQSGLKDLNAALDKVYETDQYN